MVQITKACFEDLGQILELQKLCYTENAKRYSSFNIPPLNQTQKEIESEFTNNTLLKAITNSLIVGSVRAFESSNTCYIGRLIVHPDCQNQGIGKNLMIEIENCFSHLNRFELFTGFRDEKNIYLYQKLGYRIFKQEQISVDLAFIYLEKIK
jgi:GNAT superfamily N-acetyltransferase